jgi:hypothetical protein
MSEALKNKLSNYEAMPPEGNWDRISNALDEGRFSFPEKLYKYQTQPPAGIWNRIAIYLDNLPSKGRVVPMFRRYKKQLRYAGVAVVFFALLLLAWPYFTTEQDQEIPFHNTITSIPQTRPETNQKADDTEEEYKEPVSRSGETKDIIVAKTPKQKKRKEADYYEPETIAMLDYIPSATIQNELMTLAAPADKYMIYTDESGHAMKLPKKLFDSFDCANKEIVCRQKIRDLQNRFASSAVSSDFTGLLEILRNLQENQ